MNTYTLTPDFVELERHNFGIKVEGSHIHVGAFLGGVLASFSVYDAQSLIDLLHRDALEFALRIHWTLDDVLVERAHLVDLLEPYMHLEIADFSFAAFPP